MKKILVTGTAGFIGFHLINKLKEFQYDIVGLDNIKDSTHGQAVDLYLVGFFQGPDVVKSCVEHWWL